MLVWPARCASQLKNVQARRAPAGASIRPGLSIASGWFRSGRGVLGRCSTLLIGIAFAVGMVFATQAFGSDVTDCPHIIWKHGHYVCVIDENG
jgi:hypothetical protein